MFNNIIKTLKRWKLEKVEYKIYKKRIDQLPEDYKETFEAIETYMWKFAKDGSMLEILYSTLDMFEEGVADSKTISDIVGKDIATFCDEMLKEVPEMTWINDMKKKAKKHINKNHNKV